MLTLSWRLICLQGPTDPSTFPRDRVSSWTQEFQARLCVGKVSLELLEASAAAHCLHWPLATPFFIWKANRNAFQTPCIFPVEVLLPKKQGTQNKRSAVSFRRSTLANLRQDSAPVRPQQHFDILSSSLLSSFGCTVDSLGSQKTLNTYIAK